MSVTFLYQMAIRNTNCHAHLLYLTRYIRMNEHHTDLSNKRLLV